MTHFLVARGYAARDKVFAMGGSAGGLLMGAIANLSPEDYRGIVAQVPFVDVVTTMLDDSIPLTTNEYDEWGNPAERAYYDYMLSYSPYDNVRAQEYPAMLITTGLWDSQVQYYEPAKWVAKLRSLKTDGNPLLLYVDMDAGHGGKAGRYQHYRETAKEYAFVPAATRNLGRRGHVRRGRIRAGPTRRRAGGRSHPGIDSFEIEPPAGTAHQHGGGQAALRHQHRDNLRFHHPYPLERYETSGHIKQVACQFSRRPNGVNAGSFVKEGPVSLTHFVTR